MNHGWGRKLLICVAAAFAAPVISSVIAAPAHASSWCNAPESRSISSPVAAVDFTYRACSDAVSVSGGKLYDTSCDARAAVVRFYTEYAPWQNPNNWLVVNRGGPYSTSTGCGYWSTFPDFTLNTTAQFDSPSNRHRFRVCLRAENSAGESSLYCTDILYYNI
jgi:hypothetical protein